MQLKEKKSNMERDKRKMECELEKQRQNIGKQVFLQVVQKNKKDESSLLLTPAQSKPPVETELPSSTNGLLSPLTLQTSSPSNNNQPSSLTSRRQWDKSHMKTFDLEQQNHLPNESKKMLSTQNVKANSSMSTTPTSSASQSPPSANTHKLHNQQQQQVDLTKTSYSRAEMSKAIEILKEKFVQESLNVAQAAEQIKKSQNNRLSNNQSTMSHNNNNNNNNNSTAMVKDIEVLNGKLADLQNEINRLTLLQQKQYSQQHTTAQKLLSSGTTTTTSSSNVANNSNNNHQMEDEANNDAEDEAANGNNSLFFFFLIWLLYWLTVYYSM